MVGDDQGSEDRHEDARPRVDGKDAGEAGGALDDGIEARVEGVPQDGDGEREAAAEGANPAREHLRRDQVHHRVDAKGVRDEHEDGDDEGHDAEVDGEEGVAPVGEGGHGSTAEAKHKRAAGKHVTSVCSFQSRRGAAGGEYAHRPDDNRRKTGVESEAGVFEDGGHEDDHGGDAGVLTEEEEAARDGERSQKCRGFQGGEPLAQPRRALPREHLIQLGAERPSCTSSPGKAVSSLLVATLQGEPLWGLWKEEQAEKEEGRLVGEDKGHGAPGQEVAQGIGLEHPNGQEEGGEGAQASTHCGMDKLSDEDVGGGVSKPGTQGSDHPGRHKPGEGGAEREGEVPEEQEGAAQQHHPSSSEPVAEQAATEAGWHGRIEVGGRHAGGRGEVLGHPLLHQLGVSFEFIPGQITHTYWVKFNLTGIKFG